MKEEKIEEILMDILDKCFYGVVFALSTDKTSPFPEKEHEELIKHASIDATVDILNSIKNLKINKKQINKKIEEIFKLYPKVKKNFIIHEKIKKKGSDKKLLDEQEKIITDGLESGRFEVIVDNYMNTKKIIIKNALKPCYILNYCPYGALVEYYPCHAIEAEYAIKHNLYIKLDKNKGWIKCNKEEEGASPDITSASEKVKNPYSCKLFGHDCPVFYLAEPLTEFSEMLSGEEINTKMKKMWEEFVQKWDLEK